MVKRIRESETLIVKSLASDGGVILSLDWGGFPDLYDGIVFTLLFKRIQKNMPLAKKYFLYMIIMLYSSGLLGQQGNFSQFSPFSTLNTHYSNRVKYSVDSFFIFKNTGNIPLRLIHCNGSSGSMVPTCSKDPILPNHTDTIFYKYIINHITSGESKKQIYVHTNDTHKTAYILTVNYRIDTNSFKTTECSGPIFYSEIKGIDFGDRIKGSEISGNIPFKNIGDQPLIITSCSSSCCFIPTCPRKPIMPGKSDSVYVHLFNSQNVGMYHKQVTLSTNDPNTPSISFYMKVNIIEK